MFTAHNKLDQKLGDKLNDFCSLINEDDFSQVALYADVDEDNNLYNEDEEFWECGGDYINIKVVHEIYEKFFHTGEDTAVQSGFEGDIYYNYVYWEIPKVILDFSEENPNHSLEEILQVLNPMQKESYADGFYTENQILMDFFMDSNIQTVYEE